MACTNNNNNRDNDLVDAIAANLGKVCTVFTKSGGASGCGFTGLLVQVNDDFIKVVTQLPCACGQEFSTNINRPINNRCLGNNGLTTTCTIPTNAIASFVCNQP